MLVSVTGFNTAAQPVFTLYVNQSATMDFKLAVGATQQTVEVEGTAGQVESSRATCPSAT
jgi:hypothetical protein